VSAQPRDSGENQLAKAAAKETAAAKEEAKATVEAMGEDSVEAMEETTVEAAEDSAVAKARPSPWTLPRTTITLQASLYTLRTNISF